MEANGFSRRAFLGTSAGLAAALGLGVSGCSNGPAATSTSTGAGSGASAGTTTSSAAGATSTSTSATSAATSAATTSGGGATGVLPTYAQAPAPKPDMPAQKFVEALYTKYPTTLTQSVTTKPGKGSTFTSVTPYWTSDPVPTNTAYTKAVDEALGATINHQQISANDYDTKLTAMVATGKDLPDTLACYGWAFPPKLGQALNSQFANLTEVLGGDAAKEYPNLANIPSLSWMNGVFNNQLWGTPVPSADIQVVPFYRQDLWDKKGIKEIKNKDEFLAACKELTDSKTQTYALGSRLFNLIGRWMYGLNYDWDVKDDGKFSIAYEDPRYPEALDLMSKAAKSYVHPDLLAETGDQGALFKAGKVTMISEGADFWAGDFFNTTKTEGKAAGFHANGWLAPDADGGTPVWWATASALLTVFINKRNQGDKLKELLGVMNLLASPFGTKEWELVNYGVEGTNFKRVNGAPDKRDAMVGDQYKFIASSARVLNGWAPGMEASQKERYDWMQKVAPRVKVAKASVLHVELPTALQGWRKPMDDLEAAIIKGQKPVSAFQGELDSWRKRFGDKVRDEYAKAWEANTVGK